VWSFDPSRNAPKGAVDASGNANLAGYQWNVENRLTGEPTAYGTKTIIYDPWGKRVMEYGGGLANPLVSMYSITGQRLQMYQEMNDGEGDLWFVPASGENVYFGGKMIRSQGVTVATDRLGSVRGNANGERMAYLPYGQERGNPTTPDGREKFGTYWRDSTMGVDYADQRYYAYQGVGSWPAGRFLSPDPSGASSADPQSPASWNMYAYANGDPVNLIDATGLDCGSSEFFFNGVDEGNVDTILSAQTGDLSNVAILATAMYTESGHGSNISNVDDEEDAIGSVIMNRWEFVNQNWYLSTTPGGPSINVSGWGTPGGIASIVENPSQFAIYQTGANGSVSLSSSAQNNLNNALISGVDSADCDELAFAIGLGFSMWGERNNGDPLYLINNLIVTSFNSFNPPHSSARYEKKVGSFGDANTFYGVPEGDVSETPLPVKPRKPPLRKRGPGVAQ
jgi:RHS repeat-associated protein